MPKGIYANENRVIPSRKGTKLTDEHKHQISLKSRGRKHSLETILKMSESRKGEKGSNWKGGVTQINRIIRSSLESRLWRKSVFERDNYTCIWCDQTGGRLQADHIKPFSLYPELRFAIDNGRTLCISCHMTTDTYGGKLIKSTFNFQKQQ